MNGFGLSAIGALGIGGRIKDGKRNPWQPCLETQVLVPSQMLGYGDVVMNLRSSGAGYFGFPHYYPEKTGTAEEVIAIGDQGNDISMIEWAGLGVAMGNGTAGVKAVADYVAPSANEDGAAHVIEKFVLNV